MWSSSFKHNEDEEDPNQRLISVGDMDRFVQLLKQNQEFKEYLFSFFHQNSEVPYPAQNN